MTDHTESGDCLQPALAVDLFDQPLDSRAITADQLNEKKENKIGKYDWIISNVIHEIVLSDFSQLYPTLKSIDCPKFPALRRIRFAKKLSIHEIHWGVLKKEVVDLFDESPFLSMDMLEYGQDNLTSFGDFIYLSRDGGLNFLNSPLYGRQLTRLFIGFYLADWVYDSLHAHDVKLHLLCPNLQELGLGLIPLDLFSVLINNLKYLPRLKTVLYETEAVDIASFVLVQRSMKELVKIPPWVEECEIAFKLQDIPSVRREWISLERADLLRGLDDKPLSMPQVTAVTLDIGGVSKNGFKRICKQIGFPNLRKVRALRSRSLNRLLSSTIPQILELDISLGDYSYDFMLDLRTFVNLTKITIRTNIFHPTFLIEKQNAQQLDAFFEAVLPPGSENIDVEAFEKFESDEHTPEMFGCAQSLRQCLVDPLTMYNLMERGQIQYNSCNHYIIPRECVFQILQSFPNLRELSVEFTEMLILSPQLIKLVQNHQKLCLITIIHSYSLSNIEKNELPPLYNPRYLVGFDPALVGKSEHKRGTARYELDTKTLRNKKALELECLQ